MNDSFRIFVVILLVASLILSSYKRYKTKKHTSTDTGGIDPIYYDSSDDSSGDTGGFDGGGGDGGGGGD